MRNKSLLFFLIVFLFSVELINAQQISEGSSPAIDAGGHILVTGAFTFSSCVILTRFFPDMKMVPKYLIGSAFGLIPGTLKEWDDQKVIGYWEPEDLIYNGIGACSGILLHYLLFDMKRYKHQTSINYHPEKGLALSYSYLF